MELPTFEKYSPEKIQRFVQYLKSYSDRGKPKDYEIIIDGFKVVHRTNDPSEFQIINEFISPFTRTMEIVVYTGGSQYSTKHTFTFEEEQKDKGLSGIEIENKISESVKRAKREWDFEQLQKECKEWKDYAEELEKDFEKLEDELIQIKSNQSPLHGVFGEVGSSIITGLVRKNPQMLASIPGLAGLLQSTESTTSGEVEQPAGFVPSEELSEEDKDAVKFMKYLKRKLNEEQFNQVMMVVNSLIEYPDQIPGVIEHLNIEQKIRKGFENAGI